MLPRLSKATAAAQEAAAQHAAAAAATAQPTMSAFGAVIGSEADLQAMRAGAAAAAALLPAARQPSARPITPAAYRE